MSTDAVEAAAMSTAVPAADGAPAQPATDPASTAEPAAPAAATTPRSRTVALAVARRFARFAMTLALFVGGLAAGVQYYAATNQPVTPPASNPEVVRGTSPLIVAELVSAIVADDTDGIQTVLSPQVFADYTAEISENEVASVEGVEFLGYWADGPRGATALVLRARNLEGGLVAMHLIVVTDGGQIVSLQ